MTPAQQPHPQRCENGCIHHTDGKYFDKCKNDVFPDDMDSTERRYIKDWVKFHGCCSFDNGQPHHSKQSCNHGACEECEHLAKSFATARKQERDKVLDEAIRQIKKKRDCRKHTIELNQDASSIELNAKTISIYAMAADDDSIAILEELRQVGNP